MSILEFLRKMKFFAVKYLNAGRYYLQRMSSEPGSYSKYSAVVKATQTIEFLKTTKAQIIGEIGVFKGGTSVEFAKCLNGKGQLHLFDFEDILTSVKQELNRMGYHNVIAHPNSRKTMDSYNWSIMKLLQAHKEPIFDYVYIDGSHTWAIDALTFFLIDKLLKTGGFLDFDESHWIMEDSVTMNPTSFPPVKKMFTSEQIETAQVDLIIDLLVKRDSRYTEVIPSKIFRKTHA